MSGGRRKESSGLSYRCSKWNCKKCKGTFKSKTGRFMPCQCVCHGAVIANIELASLVLPGTTSITETIASKLKPLEARILTHLLTDPLHVPAWWATGDTITAGNLERRGLVGYMRISANLSVMLLTKAGEEIAKSIEPF